MLTPGEILVVAVSLDTIDPTALPALLPREAARAARFLVEEPRRQFVASHAVLQALLARLDLPAGFERDPRGKPFLPGRPDVHLSYSHTRGAALFAFALHTPIGADIERIRPFPDAESIAERFFPPSLYAALLDLQPEDRPSGFFRLWTRFEATVKGTGVGLNGIGLELPIGWVIHDLEAVPGYAAAVAVEGVGRPVLTPFA